MFDCHFHTDLSYCSEGGMTLDFIADSIEKIEHLDGIAVTDHSFALYFPENIAWEWEYMHNSAVYDKFIERGNSNLDTYLTSIEKYRERNILPGLETEIMHDGRFTFDLSFRSRIDILIGSVHFLPLPQNASKSEIMNVWHKNTMQLLNSGIDILGHPFRWISKYVPVSDNLIKEIVHEAKLNNVAIEFNSHFEIDTDSRMIDEVIKQDVPLALSSDSHNQNETGDFSYQLNLLAQKKLSLSDFKLYPLGNNA
jgi:histidinol phosphatase-like PHP family hydrolase